MPSAHSVKLRPLEREDSRYVHQLDNNASVMRYWFEEPYEAFVELSLICMISIFTIRANGALWWNVTAKKAGLVELVEINHVHRRAEFQIIISRSIRGKVWQPVPPN